MQLVIDDSAFPAPTDLPDFATLAVRQAYRVGDDYFIKVSASAAFSFTANEQVLASGPVQPVNATLVISAPTV